MARTNVRGNADTGPTSPVVEANRQHRAATAVFQQHVAKAAALITPSELPTQLQPTRPLRGPVSLEHPAARARVQVGRPANVAPGAPAPEIPMTVRQNVSRGDVTEHVATQLHSQHFDTHEVTPNGDEYDVHIGGRMHPLRAGIAHTPEGPIAGDVTTDAAGKPVAFHTAKPHLVAQAQQATGEATTHTHTGYSDDPAERAETDPNILPGTRNPETGEVTPPHDPRHKHPFPEEHIASYQTAGIQPGADRPFNPPSRAHITKLELAAGEIGGEGPGMGARVGPEHVGWATQDTRGKIDVFTSPEDVVAGRPHNPSHEGGTGEVVNQAQFAVGRPESEVTGTPRELATQRALAAGGKTLAIGKSSATYAEAREKVGGVMAEASRVEEGEDTRAEGVERERNPVTGLLPGSPPLHGTSDMDEARETAGQLSRRMGVQQVAQETGGEAEDVPEHKMGAISGAQFSDAYVSREKAAETAAKMTSLRAAIARGEDPKAHWQALEHSFGSEDAPGTFSVEELHDKSLAPKLFETKIARDEETKEALKDENGDFILEEGAHRGVGGGQSSTSRNKVAEAAEMTSQFVQSKRELDAQLDKRAEVRNERQERATGITHDEEGRHSLVGNGPGKANVVAGQMLADRRSWGQPRPPATETGTGFLEERDRAEAARSSAVATAHDAWLESMRGVSAAEAAHKKSRGKNRIAMAENLQAAQAAAEAAQGEYNRAGKRSHPGWTPVG